MAARFTLTVRRRGQTEKRHFAELPAALDALDAALTELARGERRDTERAFMREIEPVMQVAARAELAGPRGLRAGVDLRGDGSTEAYTGRWHKRLVEQRRGEDPVSALRRALTHD